MDPKIFAPLGAFLFYSLFTALIGRATSITSAIVVLAIYSSALALVSWAILLLTGQYARVTALSWEQVGYIALLGCLLFLADFSYVKAFELKVQPAVIFGVIASIAVGAMLFTALFTKITPNTQEIIGVIGCSICAFLIYTARP